MSYFETGTGFSIELIGWRLEPRGKHEDLPLYECLGGQVTAVAIVEEPAIGVKSTGNSKNRTITGPIMIPDLKMIRSVGPNGPEKCYWYFSKEIIAELQKGYTGKVKIGH